MSIYIALLRGINVGGKNMIKMADLKKAFDEIGLNRVQTYIQSGNILFESKEEEETLRSKIEQQIEKVFGLSLSVVLRTAEEVETIIRNCPFSKEEIAETEAQTDVECLYVSLMTGAPAEEKIELLNKYNVIGDKYHVIGREVYLLFCQSVRNSKLADNLQKLDVPATVRNWKTITKLAELAKDMMLK